MTWVNLQLDVHKKITSVSVFITEERKTETSTKSINTYPTSDNYNE